MNNIYGWDKVLQEPLGFPFVSSSTLFYPGRAFASFEFPSLSGCPPPGPRQRASAWLFRNYLSGYIPNPGFGYPSQLNQIQTRIYMAQLLIYANSPLPKLIHRSIEPVKIPSLFFFEARTIVDGYHGILIHYDLLLWEISIILI